MPNTSSPAYVAIDPCTGLHLRAATAAEMASYLAQPVRGDVAKVHHAAFRQPVRVGAVLIDADFGPGSNTRIMAYARRVAS